MTRMSSSVPRAAGVAVLVAALLALMVAVFAWPAARIGPRDLPVVVAGPAPATRAFADHLAHARPGAFQVATAPDVAAADQRLRDRQAYGAFLVGAGGLVGLLLGIWLVQLGFPARWLRQAEAG